MISRTLLVTGATSGIGEALTYLAADKGYKVIACGRNEKKLSSLSQHPNIQTIQFDVSDKTQTEKALKDQHFDIAVLNAGICEYVDIDNFDIALFERVFTANFYGVINTYAALASELKPGNQLVIVDSLARLLPFTKSQAYGASKAAVHYFTKSLEVDLFAKGIIVQSASPGFVETPLTDKNDFEMPMKISVEKAANYLLTGIEKKHRSIYFPLRFSIILRILGSLPARAKKALSLKLKQESENND
jgi:short-subunit dehydrogenase